MSETGEQVVPEVEVLSEVEVDLLRFFFVLPEPVALPDGFAFTGPVGDPEEALSDDPVVGLVVHQTEVTGGRSESTIRAVTEATRRASLGPDASAETDPPGDFTVQHTVIDAVTVRDSPEVVPEADADFPQRWSPRADPLMRCIVLADRMLRAHRLATETTHGPLTYVRVGTPVIAFQAEGTETTVRVDGEVQVYTRASGEWEGASLILLDHANLADPFMGREWDEDVEQRFRYYLREDGRGNPLGLWRQRHIEARRALDVTGDLSNAVLLTATSSEVLIDAVLALLVWEEGVGVGDAAPLFEQGKVLRRLKVGIPGRLGGNWSTDAGPVGAWHSRTYRLRHRVIHGGYTPSGKEAHLAIEASSGLQRFVWDQLALRRTTYPRSALMTIAQEGLERRGLWSGQIRRFAEDVAPTEPDWRASFAAFYRGVMNAQL